MVGYSLVYHGTCCAVRLAVEPAGRQLSGITLYTETRKHSAADDRRSNGVVALYSGHFSGGQARFLAMSA